MAEYTLSDLCSLADVTPRTVRYYVAQGLLRSPSSVGPAARYDEGHLDRLRLIRQLQRQHLPLAEIRKRLAALSDQDVSRLVSESPAVTESAAVYIRGVLSARGMPFSPPSVPPPDMPSAAPLVGAPAPLARAMPAEGFAADAYDDPGPARPAFARTDRVDESELSSVTERSQWDRVRLTADIELHIRRPLSRDDNRRVERLIAVARSILEEGTR